MTICFATNNKHKLDEVKALLPEGFRLLTLTEAGYIGELPEEQDTIEGNSRQKAEFVLNRCQLPVFADDSGLLVDALNGAPGVNSAYYAGPQRNDRANVELLLANLKDHSDRRAHFKSVITWLDNGSERQFEGIVRGRITNAPRGEGGFGYDPVFIPEGFDKTFGEMSEAEKNQISHRAIAVGKLVDFLQSKATNSNG